ncbi:MAG TPA: Xaa-Pro peptidase family protein [Candidatus Peribacterales bacterium]|nr:Xaa-Pro peptidase family protein [Candidatus Peribacterales bacterium]
MPIPLLISNLTNIRYLTGVAMTFGMMIVDGRKRSLFVDSRYIEKATKECVKGIAVLPMDDLEQCIASYKRMRFESEDVSVARLLRWEKRYRKTRFVPSTGVIEEGRRVKNAAEIRSIKKACSITDRVMMEIPVFLHTRGITEKKLALLIENLSRDIGADAMAFDTIVAFGNHTARPHHSPTDRLLEKNDIVQIDMGVKVNGYCSDCSRVFFVGNVSEEQRRVFILLVKIVAKCTKRARSGATNHTLDLCARKMLGKYEPCFTHGLGHGVGLEIHEGASISTRAPKQTIKKNEVITIEPGIYLPGKFGMRVEDTILVQNSGGKTLTFCSKLLPKGCKNG